MTRIIAGSAGGRRIRAPAGAHTRPTSDRVREALFSSLRSLIGSLSGCRFLDLYAGSGAVGLEARSRGADVVTLIEKNAATAALIRSNAAALGFDGVEVIAQPVERVVRTPPPGAGYDVVFLDPPYSMPGDGLAGVLAGLAAHRWLGDDAVLVVERGRRDREPGWPAGYELQQSKRYGETMLWYGRVSERV